MNVTKKNLITDIDNGLDRFDKGYRAAYVFANVYDDGLTWSVDVFRNEHGGIAKHELKRNLWTDREEAERIATSFVMNTSNEAFGFFRGVAPNF